MIAPAPPKEPAVASPLPGSEEELAELGAYKAWAEAKIALLIQRLRDAERQRRDEASRAASEAAQLRKVPLPSNARCTGDSHIGSCFHNLSSVQFRACTII